MMSFRLDLLPLQHVNTGLIEMLEMFRGLGLIQQLLGPNINLAYTQREKERERERERETHTHTHTHTST